MIRSSQICWNIANWEYMRNKYNCNTLFYTVLIFISTEQNRNNIVSIELRNIAFTGNLLSTLTEWHFSIVYATESNWINTFCCPHSQRSSSSPCRFGNKKKRGRETTNPQLCTLGRVKNLAIRPLVHCTWPVTCGCTPKCSDYPTHHQLSWSNIYVHTSYSTRTELAITQTTCVSLSMIVLNYHKKKNNHRMFLK